MNEVTNHIKEKSAIILLSGGIDSIVSLDIAIKKLDIKLALTINYGQKAFLEENKAAIEISKFYKINHKMIELEFLKEITDNALTNSDDKNFVDFESVWVPNRNGVFLNIAASYCDKYKIDYIVFGANKEEACDFSDNSIEFVGICNEFFEYSTLQKPKIFAPCLNFDKIDIINYAIENSLPLNLIKSCYDSQHNTNKKHCGECMSCKLLKNAIKNSKKPELVEELFQ